MTQRLQQYQINVNNDIQNKKNQAHLRNLSSSSLSNARRIEELENDLHNLDKEYRSVKNDLDCARVTIDNMYQQIMRLRSSVVDEYYSILNTIKEINPHVYSQIINDCNPRRYIYTIDVLDSALDRANKYLFNR